MYGSYGQLEKQQALRKAANRRQQWNEDFNRVFISGTGSQFVDDKPEATTRAFEAGVSACEAAQIAVQQALRKRGDENYELVTE